MSKKRVDGFDLLCGICALGVLIFHFLTWSHVSGVENLGLYGVYIFFVLSGASLYISYAERLKSGFGLARFIALRFFRLAPLYALVVFATPFIERRAYDIDFWQRALLNVTFVFGFLSPGETSAATGGWSLGIEFVFYCIFPVIVAVMARGVALTALAVAASSPDRRAPSPWPSWRRNRTVRRTHALISTVRLFGVCAASTMPFNLQAVLKGTLLELGLLRPHNLEGLGAADSDPLVGDRILSRVDTERSIPIVPL